MRIVQLLPSLGMGDGVGNYTLTIDKELKRRGYNTFIYAENVDPRISEDIADEIKNMPQLGNDDVIIYHLSIGMSKLNDIFPKMRGRKVIMYHNVTPPHFFEGYDKDLQERCEDGIRAVKALAEVPEFCFADSEFNKKDLIDYGYKCPIEVLPIIIPLEDYNKKPDQSILDRFEGSVTNILFTGRVAPNKKQQDIIDIFATYKKYYNPKSRLFFVGSGVESYVNQLEDYIKKIELEGVYITGHIPFAQILSYYRLADAFVCMSEHEGFCIPLIEAMHFNIPILAYDAGAVSETMGNGGVLVNKKNALENAGLLNYILTHEDIRKKMLENQKQRLASLDEKAICDKFIEIFEKVIQGKI